LPVPKTLLDSECSSGIYHRTSPSDASLRNFKKKVFYHIIKKYYGQIIDFEVKDLLPDYLTACREKGILEVRVRKKDGDVDS